MTRIYRYILPHDTGMAPCSEGKFISLATCKPVIRRVARQGDWVLGFRPGSLERGHVLWAGKVAEVMTHGDYQREHPRRSDAVYGMRADGDYERLVPDYHPSKKEMERDLSAPVLIFDAAASLYLEGQPEPLPPELAHLAAGGQGHRVNGTQGNDVDLLKRWLSQLIKAASHSATKEGAAREGQSNCVRSCTPAGQESLKR